MSASAAAPAPKQDLPESRAIEILNSMPYLVALSGSLFRPGAIVSVAYEVDEDGKSFTFPSQPFRIMREITKGEYFLAIPKSMRRIQISSRHYYEIATD